MSDKNSIVEGAKYAAICDFEVLGYCSSILKARELIAHEKQRLDLFALLKKRFIRKVIKGKCSLPSESKHFYIAEVIE